MEPQLIDYYNEMPSGINVIDKMNEELADLQKKYDELEKKINKFKCPFIIVDSKEEYKKYNNIISNDFKQKIKDFLYDKETGLFATITEEGCHFFPESLYEDFIDGWLVNHYEDKITCKERIIDELDNITNNKNREWCKLRINIAFETCLKNKPALINMSIDENKIIDDLIDRIYNTDENLPELYYDVYDDFLEIDYCGTLSVLVCFKCKKCEKLDWGNSDLLCDECK